MPTKSQMRNELLSLRHTGFAAMLEQHATSHHLPTAYFFAIASRETNCTNELGDFQGGQYHGVGIVQIDIQHPLALTARDNGSWKTNPAPLIDFGAQMLADNIRAAAHAFPAFTAHQHLKIAASGYNCGMGNALLGSRNGDSDKHTTGHDYGRDVMTRMAIFEELLAEGA